MVQNSRAVSNSANLNVMSNAVFKAARGLVRDFGEVENLQVSRKGPGDFVSAADTKVEKILYEELLKARPTYGFLMEEAGELDGEDSSHRWIIDPLDGTTNFLHGLPHFAISVALEKDGEIIAGVIYDPVKDEMFMAEKGQGAFMNDRRLRVSSRKDMSQALLGTGLAWALHTNKERETVSKAIALMMPQSAGIRRMGSAALDMAYVAAGRLDAYWEAPIMSWDIAAGIILVKEAGGFVCDLSGKDDVFGSKSILATNGKLHRQLSKDLIPVYKG